MIRQLSVKGIERLELLDNPFQIVVEFDDGIKVVAKDDAGLRMWAVIHQNVQFERIEGSTEHCVAMPLQHYVLLGFRPGDAVLMRNQRGDEQFIVFS